MIGKPSRIGEPVPVDRALEHVFGAVLVNDWSARDIQAFEYVPLGPFLGKSFATSISPWVTTLDELTRVPASEQEPEPLEHLRIDNFAFDVPLEVELNGEVVSRTNARHLYWNVAQQIAHLTSNGASLRTGDLLATGTISGPGEQGARQPDRAHVERRPVPPGRRRGRAPRRAARRGARADRLAEATGLRGRVASVTLDGLASCRRAANVTRDDVARVLRVDGEPQRVDGARSSCRRSS